MSMDTDLIARLRALVQRRHPLIGVVLHEDDFVALEAAIAALSTKPAGLEQALVRGAEVRELRAEVARLRAALVEARVQVDCIEHYSDEAEARELACNAIEVIDAAMEPTR